MALLFKQIHRDASNNHLLTVINDLKLVRDDRTYCGSLCLNRSSLTELEPQRHQFLSPSESKRWEKIPSDERRFSFLCGRIAAKKALNRLLPSIDPTAIDIEEGVFAQPVVSSTAAHGLQVSISHTGGIAGAIAFPEKHPMGLDIETTCSGEDPTIRSQLTEKEIKIHRELPYADPLGYTVMWTIKESLSKVMKCGLTTPFSVFEIDDINSDGPVHLATFSNFAQYKALSVILNDVALSIVLPKQTDLNLEFLTLEK
ncbi:MAG: 4'-phosphopantetheinyl transferase superfamily protein [Verrucomicrobia bacterium]|nr:4'-phosphopantetheinyl transferase superfamily protein [Verrucomicrobiota bacterium]